jgi:hypothetical protein
VDVRLIVTRNRNSVENRPMKGLSTSCLVLPVIGQCCACQDDPDGAHGSVLSIECVSKGSYYLSLSFMHYFLFICTRHMLVAVLTTGTDLVTLPTVLS